MKWQCWTREMDEALILLLPRKTICPDLNANVTVTISVVEKLHSMYIDYRELIVVLRNEWRMNPEQMIFFFFCQMPVFATVFRMLV